MSLPNFFSIDIGKQSIKLLQIKDKKEIIKVGTHNFPSNVKSVVPNIKEPTELQLLANTIKSLVDSVGPTSNIVNTALPESFIFSKLITLPLIDESKIEETIYWEAQQFVPIPIAETQRDWFEVKRTKNSEGKDFIDVMVIVAPKNMVEGYLKLFELTGLELISLEVESVALVRSLSRAYSTSDGQSTKLVLDIGASGTELCVYYNNKVIYSQGLSTSSGDFTKSISTSFGLQDSQAEQYKYVYGMKDDQADGGKIKSAIKPILDIMLNEVKKVSEYITNRLQYPAPNQILLSGNGAMLPGIDKYISSFISVDTILANPTLSLDMSAEVREFFNRQSAVGFSIPIGLSLKDE
ncbi:type IV pilus assembly protein PilM [Candidatus Dojkabacteria bacterium]|nr:type IV pilus assembly protein PilM [Candidatus Dojkabacteria bacterium]